MASLKSFAKRLLSRGFSSGTGSLVTKNGGIEIKHAVIRDDKLRSVCERLEQSAKNAKQLEDECNTLFAVKKAFPTGRIIWWGLILNLARLTSQQAEKVSDTKKIIKDKETQLAACLTKRQESQLPA